MTTHPANPSPLVTQAEAGRLLGGVDRSTIYRLVKRGELVQRNVGSRALITRKSIERLIDGDDQT